MRKDANLVFYEDSSWQNLYPLTLTRPAFELRVGALTILEKWKFALEFELASLSIRPYLVSYVQQKYPFFVDFNEDKPNFLVINSTTLPRPELIKTIDELSPGEAIVEGDKIAVALITKKAWEKIKKGTPWQEVISRQFKMENITFNYLWDLIYMNGEEIKEDMKRIRYLEKYHGDPGKGIYVLGDDVYISGHVIIEPLVVLNSLEGPILIRDGATIKSHATIIGPGVIGKNSLVRVGAKILEGTTIGPVTKVGGEVEETIFIGYSNKQHDGFLGHSYIGEWVNLGAGTNNSDLKNNYSPVRVTLPHGQVNTGKLFVGLMAGDHVKSGINTMFNTGTVVGTGTNVFDAGFPPKYIPAFMWGGKQGFVEYKITKFIETARRVMARRNIELDGVYENLLKRVFEETREEREKFLKS